MPPIPPMIPVKPLPAKPRTVFPAKAGIQCRRWLGTLILTMTIATIPISSAHSQPPPLPAATSSMWHSPRVNKFLLEVLGDSQKVNYHGFPLLRQGRFEARVVAADKAAIPSWGPLWVDTPDSSMAAMINSNARMGDELLTYKRRQNGKVERICSGGGRCDYRGVFWIDSVRLLLAIIEEQVVGISNHTVATVGFTPVVVLFDFVSGSTFAYVSTRNTVEVDPYKADSLIWNSPRFAKFLLNVLGDSQTVNYRGFALEGSGKFATEDTYAHKLASPPADSYWVYSPNRRLAAMALGGDEPDNELWLYNWHGAGMAARLEVCGTMCLFRSVMWFDNQRLVFAQVQELDEHFESPAQIVRYRPVVKIFDLSNDSVRVYGSSPYPTGTRLDSGVFHD
ncbi:MAG: hypothetical protein HZB43_00035 [candidate division Zixibacteria bacterium]|nr:hypothetical protein [candidate division Zixibacteria bacterium]